MNLIERVAQAMLSDDEDLDRQSSYLVQLYLDASEAEQRLLDNAFIALCGWSLRTLLNERD